MRERRHGDLLAVTATRFPDLELPDQAGNVRRLSELAGGDPLVLSFYRGWWCPKEQSYWTWGRPSLEELRRDLRTIYESDPARLGRPESMSWPWGEFPGSPQSRPADVSKP